ncbi:MAG TPA: hypothetical protein VEW26_02020, partial [Allosphingosinicella sp.]|nr:hypothetical protein [Allosphingosinicella sp.]
MLGMNEIQDSYASAVLIGIVVSLDVGGLLISQHREFKNVSLGNFGVMARHARRHASVHSGLFLLYIVLAEVILYLATLTPWWIVEFFESIARVFSVVLPPIDGTEAAKSMVLLSSVIVVCIVWITYAGKIVENHKEKLATSGNPLSESRADIQGIYRVVKILVSNNRKRIDIAMALAVAVDMLAISSVIRVYFPGAIDAGRSAGKELDAQLYHFDFGFGGDLAQPLIFG